MAVAVKICWDLQISFVPFLEVCQVLDRSVALFAPAFRRRSFSPLLDT